MELWRTSTWLPRSALLLAGVSVMVLLGTLFDLGLTGPPTDFVYVGIHAGVIGLGLVLLSRVVWQQMRNLRGRESEAERPAIPRKLKLATCAAFIVLVVFAVIVFAKYGEGGAELRGGQYVWVRDGRVVRQLSHEDYVGFQVAVLRVFASAWLAFSLMIAWVGITVDHRLRRPSGITR